MSMSMLMLMLMSVLSLMLMDQVDGIAGGSDANPPIGYPWMAALYGYNQFICGGTLIASNWILTSAKCSELYTPSDVMVQLNRYNLNESPQNESAVILAVTKIVSHPLYNPKYYNYDVALWKLASSVTNFTEISITPTNLPVGNSATALGWGPYAAGIQSNYILSQVNLPAVNTTYCQDVYPRLSSNSFCAGTYAGGTGTCALDYGGPLVLNIGSNPIQVGIISDTKGCGQMEYPSLFTSISALSSWIQAELLEPDHCSPNPCQNNGVCTNRPSTFYCDCTGTGYSGTYCSVAPCTGITCLNTLSQKITFGGDLSLITSTINFSGLNFILTATTSNNVNYLRVFTKIKHPRPSDLDIRVQSPNGTVVILTQGLGGNYADIFDGTSWERDAPYSVSAYPYISGEFAGLLIPMNSSSAFNGCSPNGQWKLYVNDTVQTVPGSLWEWGIEIVDSDFCAPNPCQNDGACKNLYGGFVCYCVTGYSGTFCEIPFSSSISCISPNLGLVVGNYQNLVSHSLGLNEQQSSSVHQIHVFVSVNHTYSSDLKIVLMTPFGTSIILTEFNGYDFPNIYSNMTFQDGLSNSVTNYTFNLAFPIQNLSPQQSMEPTFYQNIYGDWTLMVYDEIGDDTGVFNQWGLLFNFGNYCTSNPCKNGGACVSLFTTYTCNCPSGYSGTNCQITPIVPSASPTPTLMPTSTTVASTSSSSLSTPSSSLSTPLPEHKRVGMIVGAIIGVLFGLAILGVIGFFTWRFVKAKGGWKSAMKSSKVTLKMGQPRFGKFDDSDAKELII